MGVAQHKRIPFITYPREWPAEMLHAAAKITLKLAQDFLYEGYALKDVTPYNIVFGGGKPAGFWGTAKSYFKIERKTEVIPGQRILYLFSKHKVTLH